MTTTIIAAEVANMAMGNTRATTVAVLGLPVPSENMDNMRFTRALPNISYWGNLLYKVTLY